MTDPYEKQLRRETREMLRQTDGRLELNSPRMQTLADHVRHMQSLAAGKAPLRARIFQRDSEHLQDISHSKSSRIAEIVRSRQHVPRPVRIGFGVAALAALAGGLLWRRKGR